MVFLMLFIVWCFTTAHFWAWFTLSLNTCVQHCCMAATVLCRHTCVHLLKHDHIDVCFIDNVNWVKLASGHHSVNYHTHTVWKAMATKLGSRSIDRIFRHTNWFPFDVCHIVTSANFCFLGLSVILRTPSIFAVRIPHNRLVHGSLLFFFTPWK